MWLTQAGVFGDGSAATLSPRSKKAMQDPSAFEAANGLGPDEFEALAFVEAHAWAETMADFQGLLLELAEGPASLYGGETTAVQTPQNEAEKVLVRVIP